MVFAPRTQLDLSNDPPVPELFKPRRKIPFIPIIGVSITAIVAIGIVIGLMWQSNSFIAQKQDVRSEGSQPERAVTPVAASSEEVAYVNLDDNVMDQGLSGVQSATGFVPGQLYLSPVDQRFGVNGGCGVARTLGIPWTYNWGWMSDADRAAMQPDNVNEIRCNETTRTISPPTHTLITLAKNDGITSTIWTETDVNNWLARARAEGKWDETADTAALNRLGQLFPEPSCDITMTNERSCGPQHPKRYTLARIKANYIQIPYITRRYPGAHYQISNEPDFGLSFFPVKYAEMYKLFYDKIKRHDRNAKISIGALGMVEFDHPFNEREMTFNRNTGYQWVMPALVKKGLDTPQNRDIAWLRLVFDEYKIKYNKILPVDFWSIHPYPWPPFWENPSLYNIHNPDGSLYSWQWPASKVDAAVADTVAQVDKFKTAIAQPAIAGSNKPIWITELSILVNTTKTRSERDTEALAVQIPYIQKSYNQLLPTKKVQKIFWHTTIEDNQQRDGYFKSMFVFQQPASSGIYNNVGKELARQKGLYADTSAPIVNSVALISSGKAKLVFDVNAQDQMVSGQSPSGLYAIRYIIFTGTGTSPVPPQNQLIWKSELTTKSPHQVETTYVGKNQYIAAQAEDAFGNISSAKIVKIP